jgi:hypothetical protein
MWATQPYMEKPREAEGEVNSMALVETAYSQLCESYRAIDDFRAKLLGALPAATGAAILLTSKEGPNVLKDWAPEVGLFGGLITCGLFLYEVYGIEKCAALIRAGKKLELSGKVQGQFCSRPHAVGDVINEPLASAFIYPSVLAAWLLLASLPILSTHKAIPIVIVCVIAALLWWRGFRFLRDQDVRLNKGDTADCDACGRPLGSGDRRRVFTVMETPDYWLCRDCSEAVKG